MEKNLTPKQRIVYSTFHDYEIKHGKAPTFRELLGLLKGKLELRAISSVQRHINTLRQKGYLSTEKYASRGTKIKIQFSNTVNIPLVGNVACGVPILAEENITAYIPYDKSLIGKPENYFFLQAHGDSMNKADVLGNGIDDGDFVLVKKQSTANFGDRIVALLEDEATIKKMANGNGHIRLEPESNNPTNKPILLFNDFSIQGLVIDVIKNKNK
ncbi:MAG: transcriptional repressor LexA [bacterium]